MVASGRMGRRLAALVVVLAAVSAPAGAAEDEKPLACNRTTILKSGGTYYVEGRVRIVTIAGFDAQACGGTHVHSTAEIGPARLIRVDNKGRDNTRFYWTLTP